MQARCSGMDDTVVSRRLTALAALAALSACQPAPGDDGDQPAEPAAAGPAVSEAPTPRSAATAEPPALTAEAAKGEAGARAVLLDWASALENGDFATAYALSGNSGVAEDLSEAEYAEQWSGFERLTVAVPEGRVEGAAGSLYYEVPATITARAEDGSTARWQGPVTLRRVNDVPGASAEQLRWHIESAELVKQPG